MVVDFPRDVSRRIAIRPAAVANDPPQTASLNTVKHGIEPQASYAT
jgi:hypothetical protein